MALVLGTNCGFVSVAPTTDPDELNTTINSRAAGMKHTSPSGAVNITEIGWYSDDLSEETNFEVAIYDHDSGNDRPKNIVGVSRTNAKGTGSGWKVVSGLNIEITSSTIYWIIVQVDDTATATRSNYKTTGGTRRTRTSSGETTLDDPFQSSTENADFLYGIYAIVETEAGVTRKIKIDGTFQEKPIKTKVAGTFEDKPIKIKVGGTFQDA